MNNYDKILNGELSSGDAANLVEKLEAELSIMNEAESNYQIVTQRLRDKLETLAAALFEIENGGRCLAPHSGGVPCEKCHCCIARAALVKVGLKGGV